MQDIDSFLMGGKSRPSLKLIKGVWGGGRIIETPELRQATEYNPSNPGVPGSLKFWKRDGKTTEDPIMVCILVVQTDQRDDADDDGVRTIWLEAGKNITKAVSAGVKEATADLPKVDQGLRLGGDIRILHYDDEVVPNVRDPRKLHKAVYRPPAVSVPSGPSDDPWGGTNAAPAATSAPPTDPFAASHTAQPASPPPTSTPAPVANTSAVTPKAVEGARAMIQKATTGAELDNVITLWEQHYGPVPDGMRQAIEARRAELNPPPPADPWGAAPPVNDDPWGTVKPGETPPPF